MNDYGYIKSHMPVKNYYDANPNMRNSLVIHGLVTLHDQCHFCSTQDKHRSNSLHTKE